MKNFFGIRGTTVLGFGLLGGTLVLWSFAYAEILSQRFLHLAYFGCLAVALLLAFRHLWPVGKVKKRRPIEGFVSEDVIYEMAQADRRIQLDSVTRDISVMFIDIADFSLIAKAVSLHDGDELIRDFFDMLHDLVYRYEGTIIRSQGDGLLVIFGYDLCGSESVPGHESRAVNCAFAIQRKILESFTGEPAVTGKPIFLARIGINSDSCIIGNYGSGGRIDMNVFGEGVILAQRLEASCEPYSVIIGERTKRALDDPDILMVPKLIKIKNTVQLVEAWECDPFPGNRSFDIGDTLRKHREFLSINKKGERVKVKQCFISTDDSVYQVYDISKGGFGLVSNHYFGKGVMLGGTILSDYDEVMKPLAREKLLQVHLEVKWSSKSHVTGEYILGTALTGLSEVRKNRIFKFLTTEIALEVPQGESIGSTLEKKAQ